MAKLVLRLHGAFRATWADRQPCALKGTKQQALIALLATAPDMTRKRSWLIAMLWSDADEVQARRNLRQLLHGLKKALGTSGSALISGEGDLLSLDERRVTIATSPRDGEFLEGFDLAEEGFEDWLRAIRFDCEDQMAALLARPVAESTPEGFTRLRKRLMVLPFQDAAGGSASGLGDALAHQLTVTFARTGLMDTISHLSARQFATEAQDGTNDFTPDLDFRLIGRWHGGPDGGYVDVTLEDCIDSSILWGDRFKLDAPNSPDCQQEVVGEIAGQIIWIALAQSCRIAALQPMPETSAHNLMMGGIAHMHSFARQRFLDGGLMLEEVTARCPRASQPWAWIGQWHLLSVHQGWVTDGKTARKLAGDAVARALDTDPYCELALTVDGNIRNVMDGDFDAAGQRFAEAQMVNPSSAMTCQLAALHSSFTGRGEEAVSLTERAAWLAPRDPRRPFFAGLAATAYLAAHQFDQAVAQAEIALTHNPGHVSANRCKVIGLQSAGRDEEARAAAAKLRVLCPGLTVEGYLASHAAARTPVGREWANALKQAGIPAH